MKNSKFQYIITNKTIKPPIFDEIILECSGLRILINKSNIENLIVFDKCIFFGESFDYENPDFINYDIVSFIKDLTFDEKIKYINKLSGFYIFIFIENENAYLFNDSSGQLEAYIYCKKDDLIISSQPNLINKLIGHDKIEYDDEAPEYIINNKLNIFNKTPFKNIEKLTPNFYYDINNRRSVRFFPLQLLQKKTIENIATSSIIILENTITSILNRKDIAIAITAGLDSRVLFAISLKHEKNISYFVINDNSEDGKIDVEVSKKITRTFNKNINVINYDFTSSELLEEMRDIVWKDEIIAHYMAKIMKEHYPDSYIINGNISEIARNYYDPLPNNISIKDICYIIGVKEGAYEQKAVQNWIKTTTDGLHLLDYIYWEHRMPNWVGSVKSIYNLYTTVLSPFNNRELLSILLSSDRKDRDKYFNKIYRNILQKIDKIFVEIPINPTKKYKQIVLMKKMRIYSLYRYVFFKLRKLKL